MYMLMIKLTLILCACLFHWNTIDKGQPFSTMAATQAAKGPILWTADYSPDGKYYAVGSSDRLLKVYRADNHELLHSFKLPAAVQFLDWNTNSRLLAIALDDNPVQ